MVSRMDAARRSPCFTLIELIVVMAIIGLLASIVAPRHQRTVEPAREASLTTSPNVMRDAIDKFAGDRARLMDSKSWSRWATSGRSRKTP